MELLSKSSENLVEWLWNFVPVLQVLVGSEIWSIYRLKNQVLGCAILIGGYKGVHRPYRTTTWAARTTGPNWTGSGIGARSRSATPSTNHNRIIPFQVSFTLLVNADFVIQIIQNLLTKEECIRNWSGLNFQSHQVDFGCTIIIIFQWKWKLIPSGSKASTHRDKALLGGCK